MKSVLEYLEETAGRMPDQTAVIDEKERCSYQELLRVSRGMGASLLPRNLSGRPVAVMMKKSLLTLECFFGIAYAGGFYCLLDPDFPRSRLKKQISILQPEVVITLPEHAEKLHSTGYEGDVFMAEKMREEALAEPLSQEAEQELTALRDRMEPSAPLYCNFTSGSTGTPKGVLVGHDSVIAFIDAFTPLFSITKEDVIGNQAPFDFDVSVKDIFSAMKTGATLVIIPTAFFRFPAKVMDMLQDNGVTTLIWAVSALVLIDRLHGFLYKVPDKISKVLFSGEEMPPAHLQSWMTQYPKASFVNLYGPTEITCNCTYYRIETMPDPEKKIPIGMDYPGKEVFLCDPETGDLIPPEREEETGELCVTGAGLAIGYYKNEEATKAAFVTMDLPGKGKVRVYRTGDLARKKEGLWYFAGRKDFQIKHNGHRIELEEIQRAMNSLPEVLQSCCIYVEEKYRIVAFYTGEADKKSIVAGLKEKLPDYMIPTVYMPLSDFPLNKNGKIDRKALRESLIKK
ncbi:MAG: amino acid adenylation domain-containing protein [Lachnospiraceae bacterium]|nr:amino acid adenylation domain-containing protein [Lachnospiraceae bacterium]